MAISQKWKDTVNQGIKDTRWDEYDSIIKTEIASYNNRFSKSFDWLKVKAMLWTESGGPDNAVWKKRVMQIGNPKDPAYDVLKNDKEGSSLIMDDALRNKLKVASNIDDPKTNVKAAIAYLVTRMAQYKTESIRDKTDTKEYSHTIVSGDNLSKIAKNKGTTVAELKKSNPRKAAGTLKIADVLKYHKAQMGLVISGWRTFDTGTIAKRYNGGGDPDYEAKLNYVLKEVFPKLEPESRR